MAVPGKISFWAAVLMSINIIVGAGYLLSTSKMAALAGSASFLYWIFGGLLVFPVIWCIAQASQVFPGEGGFYNYCSKGINPFFGFLAQWVYLVGYMGTAMVFVMALKDNLVNRAGLTIVADYPTIYITVTILFFTLLNMLPITMVSKIQSIATVFKLVPMLMVIALIPFYFSTTVTYAGAGVGSLAESLPVLFFAFWGFEACVSIAHMLKGGPTVVARVMLTGFFLIAVTYMLFHFGLIHIMGAEALGARGAAVFPQYLGFSPQVTNIIGTMIIGAIILSFMNCIFGVLLGNMTNFYQIAKSKLIVGSGAITKTTKQDRPIAAGIILAVVLWSMLMLIDKINIGVAITNMGVSSAFVLTLVALFLHNLKRRNIPQLLVTLLGFVSCGILIFYSWCSISPDAIERIVYCIPLFVGVIIGIVLNACTPKQKTWWKKAFGL